MMRCVKSHSKSHVNHCSTRIFDHSNAKQSDPCLVASSLGAGDTPFYQQTDIGGSGARSDSYLLRN